MPDCLFCQIAAKELPSLIIYEDKNVVAFLDIAPVRPGHTLLIPKKHYANFITTPDEILAGLMSVAKKIMSAQQRALSADFVMVYVVGIDISHTHIHLLPRNADDGLYGWPTGKYEGGEAEKVARDIKAAISL